MFDLKAKACFKEKARFFKEKACRLEEKACFLKKKFAFLKVAVRYPYRGKY